MIDARDQYLASYIFVSTGQFGTANPPGGFQDMELQTGEVVRIPKLFFWQAPNRLYYQTHDIGNPLLMMPIAAIQFIATKGLEVDPDGRIPTFIKPVLSAWFSIQGALVTLIIFSAFRITMSIDKSLLYSGLFLPTNFFLTYIRMPWDVTGAGMFAILAFYQLLRYIYGQNDSIWRFVIAGLSVGMATNFRYSFGPFLLVMIILGALPYRQRIPIRHVAIFVVCCIASAMPSLIYNYVRMGDPFHPATVIPRYPTKPTLNADIPINLLRMFLSMNKGLFVFVPFLFFGLLFRNRQQALLLGAVISGLLLYAAGLSATASWSGGHTWGPRYLVPVLPILYYLAAIQAETVPQGYRWVAVGLLVISCFINLPTYFINYQIAIHETPTALDDTSNYPYPQIAIWKAFFNGLSTGEMSLRPETVQLISEGKGTASAVFPDFFMVHLSRYSGNGSMLTVFVGLMVLSLMLLSIKKINKGRRQLFTNN